MGRHSCTWGVQLLLFANPDDLEDYNTLTNAGEADASELVRYVKASP